MYETLGLDILPRQAAILLGLALGLAFGVLAEVSKFCFRRAVAGPIGDRRAAAGVWLAGLATAIIGTQLAVTQGLISFDEHRFLATDLPWLAILLGGLMFGAGMVLTRGCVSRLTVLTGTGNLRAALVLVVSPSSPTPRSKASWHRCAPRLAALPCRCNPPRCPALR